MSDARRLPGQSILERIGARGLQRPQLGASPGFYERFGLADPWTVEERWMDESTDSPFYFLSAAPYYARLRSMKREARARRRLLDRLEAEPFAVRGFAARMSGGIAAALPMRGVAARGFGIPSVDVSSLTALDPAAAAEIFLARREEGQGEAPREARERPTRSSRDAWAVRKQLAELAPLARTAVQRRALKAAVEEIELLPEREQVHAARRIVRRIKGPSSRIATAVVERTVERVDSAPAAVARTRALPHLGKGLRRILGSTPAMATLEHEVAPQPEAVAASPARTRQVESIRPSRTAVAVPRVVREARAQLQTGRAGPPATAASTAATPVAGPARSLRRRPTARAVARALAAPMTPAIDTRRGLAASAPEVPARRVRSVARAAARSQAGERVTAQGAPFVAPSVTSYVPADRPVPGAVRRSRAVRAAPSSWLVPGAAETVEVAAAPTARAVAPVRRAIERGAASVEAAPTRTGARSEAAPPRLAARTARGPLAPVAAPRAVTPAAARAVLRAEPVLRRDTAGRALLSPATVAHVPAAQPFAHALTARRSRLVAPTAVPIAPSEILADEAPTAAPSTPTARRAAARRAATPEAAVPSVARRAAEPAAPTLRASARGMSAPTEHVALARRPMAHVGAEHTESVASPALRGVSTPALQARSAVRRSRVVAPSAVPLTPEAPSTEPTVDAGPIARRTPLARRAAERADEPALASSPTLRAATRSVTVAARDERGADLVAAEPTRYVRRPVDPLHSEVATRAEVRATARAEGPTRRARVVAPSSVLPTPEPTADEPAGIAERPAPAAARRARAAAEPSAAEPTRRAVTRSAAGAAAHAVRRVTHAIAEAAPVRSTRPRPVAPARQAATETAASTRAAAPALRRGSRRSLIPRAVAPISLAIPSFGELQAGPMPQVRVAASRSSAAPAAPVAPRLAPARADSIDAIVERVAGALRAAFRGEEPTVVLDAARRTLRVRSELPPMGPMERADGRLGAQTAPSMARFAPSAPALTLPEAVEAADMGSPAELAFAPQAGRAARVSSRRLAPSPAARILGRHTGTEGLAPRWTQVRADGTVVRVPSEVRASTRVQARARTARAAGRADLLRTGPGFGAPAMSALAPQAAPAPGEGEVERPLGRTLGQLDPDTAPLPGSPAAPGWAHRAVHGTAATTREQLRAVKALRADSGLFTALARSSTPDEVIRVILERGDSPAAIKSELGAPAAAMVERIVRMRREVADTDQVLRPGRGEAPDEIAPGVAAVDSAPLPGQGRRPRVVRGVPSSFLSPARSRDGVGASGVMKLAGKLQRLIHLAETERRLRDAQAQVRMSTEQVSEGSAIAGSNPTTDDETPGIDVLQRDVIKAVMAELELNKMRS